jgi:hypothetical protein
VKLLINRLSDENRAFHWWPDYERCNFCETTEETLLDTKEDAYFVFKALGDCCDMLNFSALLHVKQQEAEDLCFLLHKDVCSGYPGKSLCEPTTQIDFDGQGKTYETDVYQENEKNDSVMTLVMDVAGKIGVDERLKKELRKRQASSARFGFLRDNYMTIACARRMAEFIQ